MVTAWLAHTADERGAGDRRESGYFVLPPLPPRVSPIIGLGRIGWGGGAGGWVGLLAMTRDSRTDGSGR